VYAVARAVPCVMSWIRITLRHAVVLVFSIESKPVLLYHLCYCVSSVKQFCTGYSMIAHAIMTFFVFSCSCLHCILFLFSVLPTFLSSLNCMVCNHVHVHLQQARCLLFTHISAKLLTLNMRSNQSITSWLAGDCGWVGGRG
jgi:hypothetical protein